MKNITIATHQTILSLLFATTKDLKVFSKASNVHSKMIEKHINVTNSYSTKLILKPTAEAPPDFQILFSAIEIILFIICFDYYYQNYNELDEDRFVYISLSTLNRYRKISKMTSSLKEQYKIAFYNLSVKNILISFDLEECKQSYIKKLKSHFINETLIEYEEVYKNKKLTGFKFRFNNVFDLILKSSQKTTMSAKFLEIKSSQIIKLCIAIFIESFIRTNYRKDIKRIRIKNIMKSIPFFSKSLEISGITLLDKIDLKDISSYKILKKFSEELKDVLDILQLEDTKLKSYELDDINIKNYDAFDTYLTLRMKE